MTFQQRTRRAFLWGTLMILAGGVVNYILQKWGEEIIPYLLYRPLYVISGLVAFAGILSIVFVGCIRPIHRWLWLNGLSQSQLLKSSRDMMVTGPGSGFWHWWLHVDESGKDLDGRNGQS
ncbi:hypothetical protein [Paracoccus alkanivorans]|uniref:hypothetical protein n=1 Tax=Paracoccus alkanivorans TaxID=2116655 RepID=UPI0011C375A0|nr:hypothetical protein [Paracoccus alkanivorans]